MENKARFTFKSVVYNGVPMYRICSLVNMRVGMSDAPVCVGTEGGYVEHPEDLDDTQDIWIYQSAVLTGHVHIEGNVYIRNAKVKDSVIIGNVNIGDEPEQNVVFPEDKFIAERTHIQILNSVIDSTHTDDPENSEIFIMNHSYVKNSKIYGDSSLNDRVHVIESVILDSALYGHAFACRSKIDKDSGIDAPCMIYRSCLSHTTIRSDAVIEGVSLTGKNISGSPCVIDKDGLHRGRKVLVTE